MRKKLFVLIAGLVWVSEAFTGVYGHEDLMRRLNELTPARAKEAKILQVPVQGRYGYDLAWVLIYRDKELKDCGENCD